MLNDRCSLAISVSTKNLSYCRMTARRYTLLSSYVSRSMAVRKVSISKSNLQGHSRALALVPFDRPHWFPTIVRHCN